VIREVTCVAIHVAILLRNIPTITCLYDNEIYNDFNGVEDEEAQ
jgi:hypothetical protein